MRTRLVLIFSLITSSAFAQNTLQFPTADEGVTIGIEKNYSAAFEYDWKQGFFVGAKHTLVADKVDYQSFRAMGGYRWRNPYISISSTAFATSDWKASFGNVGAIVQVNSEYFSKYAKIGAEYIPYYDSGLGFQHGWSVSGEVNITRDISLLSEFGRKPDYRIAYKRVYAGAKFHVQNLTVVPMLEIPIYDSGLHASHSGIVVSMSYSFK